MTIFSDLHFDKSFRKSFHAVKLFRNLNQNKGNYNNKPLPADQIKNSEGVLLSKLR